MTEGYNCRSRVSLCGMKTWAETYQSTEAWRRALATASNWREIPGESGYYTLRTEDEGLPVDNPNTTLPHDNSIDGVKRRFEGTLDDLAQRRLSESQAKQLGRAAESRVRVGSADKALGNAIGKK